MAIKVIKMTMEKLMIKAGKLRIETGFPLDVTVVEGTGQYKVVLIFGGTIQLFGQPLTTREAAFAIDMLRLIKQMDYKLDPAPPITRCIRKDNSLLVNENGVTIPTA